MLNVSSVTRHNTMRTNDAKAKDRKSFFKVRQLEEPSSEKQDEKSIRQIRIRHSGLNSGDYDPCGVSVAYVVGRGSMWRLGSNGKYRHLWNQVIESLGLEDKTQEDKLLDDSTFEVYPDSKTEELEPHNQCFSTLIFRTKTR